MAWERKKHIVGNTRVEFSQEATVRLPNGAYHSAFPRHSFIARVTDEDAKKEVIVSLPPGAAKFPESSWVQRAVEAAAPAPPYAVVEVEE